MRGAANVQEMFFFFQAEDGIRCFHVTGVQTCALPICRFACELQGFQAPKCVCGQRHWYAECAYLDASVAPSGWTENPAIRKRIDEQLAKPEKKARIDQAIKNSKERKAKQQKENIDKNEIPHQSFTSAFTTFRTNEEFPLRNSFILDSGADIHVCNNIDRAIGPIRPADTGERLAAGS